MLKGEFSPTIKDSGRSKFLSSNYRPVMSSTIFMKVFEYCLLPALQQNIKLSSRQYGFCSGVGCIDSAILLKEVIKHYNSKKSNLFCCLIDMSKAFDRINIDKLIQKLIKTSVPTNIVNILEFMMKNTFVSTVFNGTRSDTWRILCGTRQGGILSPLIFNFYIDDVLRELNSIDIGCSLHSYNVTMLAYADDLILLSPSANGLQFLIDKVCVSISSLDLKINVSKTKFICFRHRKSFTCNATVKIEGTNLERVHEVRFLGVIFSQDISDIKPDVDRVTNSFLVQFNSLYYKFNFLSTELLSFLLQTYCMSFYGVELWYDKLEVNYSFNRIAVVYHRAIKKICGMNPWDSNHEACHKVNKPIFKHMLVKRGYNLYRRLNSCKNSQLRYIFFRSNLGHCIRIVFKEVYSINVDSYDVQTVYARIDFVQRNEERSHYSYIP